MRARFHPTIAAAAEALRDGGMTILAANPSPAATDYREIDFTRPTAILFGQEKDGLTPEALALADGAISIPMVGFVASLNVSVAAAVVLFEAQRQRAAAGFYERCRLDRGLFDRTLFEWAHPRRAAECRRRGLPYPPLGPAGEIQEP